MIGPRPICSDCKHLHDDLGFKCDAFPEGIPDEIITGGFIHKKPFPGDNGIQFEEIK
jgi:hypothetical protein